MKILVLSWEGMLGHKMLQILLERYLDTPCTVARSLAEPFYRKIDLFRQGKGIDRVDAMVFPAPERTLLAQQPEFIVNCIVGIKQRGEAKSPLTRIALNSLFPYKPAEI